MNVGLISSGHFIYLKQLPYSLMSFLQLIGVEGGFTDQEPEYDETFEIVILPEFISLPFPSVDLPEKVKFMFHVKDRSCHMHSYLLYYKSAG